MERSKKFRALRAGASEILKAALTATEALTNSLVFKSQPLENSAIPTGKETVL
jgi:hypothetical protein